MWVLYRRCVQTFLYSTFALYILSFQIRWLLSLIYTASFLLPWGKVLGLDLIGDRYTQISLSASFQITCHSASSLREVGGVRSEVLPFFIESKWPKVKPFWPLIINSDKILARRGSWSRGIWLFGDPECFLSNHLVFLPFSRHLCQHGPWLFCVFVVFLAFHILGEPLSRDLDICLPEFCVFLSLEIDECCGSTSNW